MSKTRIEYLEIFNLEATASNELIAARYNELYSDFQIRLTNAPTPNLKKLYQKNLLELEEAYAQLTGNAESLQLKTDLPSSKPVQNANTGNSEQTTNKSRGGNQRSEEPQVLAGRSAKTNNQTGKDNKTGIKGGKNISATVFILTVVVALAGLALLATLYIEGKKEVSEFQNEAAKNQEFLKHKDLFKNGKFKVENRTTEKMKLMITHITFFNNKGELKEYKFLGGDDNPDPLIVDLMPGKTVNINQYAGLVKWDGSVVSYAMLAYQGESSILRAVYSGIWLHEWPENKMVITN